MPEVERASRWTADRAGLLASCLAALAVLAPVLPRRGYLLTYDMVFVPRPALDRSLLGLGSGLARAVPNDLVVALASRVLPGDLVQRLALVLLLVLWGWGAARLLAHLVPGAGPVAGAATAVAAVWTPATYERLVLGQWALLVSLAALPWALAAAARLREGGARLPLLVALAGAAVGSPAGSLLVAACATVVAGWPGPGHPLRRGAGVAGVGLLLALPWLVPSVLREGGAGSDPAGLAAFAPRADTPLGRLGSLLTLGGVWSRQVTPPARGSLVVLLLAVGLVAVGAWGLALGLRARRPVLGALLACAVAGLVLALAPVTPGLSPAATWVVRELPGGGLLRDGQKYLAPWWLAVALGVGLAAEHLLPRLAPPGLRAYAAAVLVLLPVAALPGLAWGAAGRLVPAAYPADWLRLDAAVRGGPGAVLVLPFTAYRAPDWNGRRVVLDPAPRFLGRPAVVDDSLRLGNGTVVRGEDPLAARVGAALSGSAPLAPALAGLGIGWVVVERGEVGAPQARERLGDLPVALNGEVLTVLRVPGARPATADPVPVRPVVVVDVLVVAALVGGGLLPRRADRTRTG